MVPVPSVFKIISVVIVLGLFLLAGCSRLPAYSQPRVEAGDASRTSQVISYRDLTVSDFRAPALPEDLRRHGQHLNAHTSVAIRTHSRARYVFAPEDEGRHSFCGHVENLLFEAVMLPEKSWWSPTLAKERETYVMQHEQVHFAMMAVAARQLNRRAAVERDQLTVCATASETAQTGLSATIDRWMADSQKETLERHEEFDEATSRLFAPKIQQWWYDRVRQELSALAEWQ